MLKNITIYIISFYTFLAISGTVFAQDTTDTEKLSIEAEKAIEIKDPAYGNIAANVDELDVRNMDVKDVLEIISLKTGVKINYDEEIEGQVTILFRDINILDALRIIVDMHDLAFIKLKSENDEVKAIHVMTGQRYQSLYGYSFKQEKQTETVTIVFADPQLLLSDLRKMKSSTGKVTYDETTKSFILVDAVSKVEEMKNYIEQMDVKSSKTLETETEEIKAEAKEDTTDYKGEIVGEDEDSLFSIFRLGNRDEKYEVQVDIYEITLNDEHQEGVDWEAIVSNYQSLPFLGFRSTAKHDPEGELRVGTISDEDYVVLLDALDTVGVVENLENDKYRGRLEKEYEIDVKPSDRILVTDIREYRDMFKRDEFVRLIFNTTKDPEGLFEIEIKPEIRPNYYTRNIGSVTTKLEEKHVVVIGGLFKDIEVKGNRKIPILGDLPFLGFAFRDNQDRIRKVEYVVFLTMENLEN